ncbi:MAG: TVP38/TMEM64 family protein [Candidatus Binatia bacterium]
MSKRRNDGSIPDGRLTVSLLHNLSVETSSGWLSGSAAVGVRIAAGIVIAVLLVGGYVLLSQSGALAHILDRAALQESIVRLGLWGPIAVIGLMAVAIVLSPIPSAPIALAAGAAFGHTFGTIYVLIGAEIGALVAFVIARLVGYEVVQKWFGDRLALGLRGSQNALMVVVFVTRLIPFISFDVVSYAAGLTPLTTWRFAVATLVGITPASFLLAHFGGEMASAEAPRIAISVLALGGLTLIPVAVKVILAWRRK